MNSYREITSPREILGFLARVSMTDAQKLKFLNRVFGDSALEMHHKTQNRIMFLNALKPVSEGGMVELHTRGRLLNDGMVQVTAPTIAVVWSGMDCDCSAYSNKVRFIDVTYDAKFVVEDHILKAYEYADGPCNWFLMKPSEAERLTYHSRDLALEAFEDGHPHVVYG